MRDPVWVESILKRSRGGPGLMRELLDGAIKAIGRYKRLRPKPGETREEYAHRSDMAWDLFFDRLDLYLAETQRRHLEEVDEAGVSGRPEVEPAATEI